MTPMFYGRGVWEMSKYVQFLEARVHVSVGAVVEPSALNDPVLLAVVMMLLVPGAYAGWRVYTSSWIGNPWIWSTLLLGVFMFATSGAAHAATRTLPNGSPNSPEVAAAHACAALRGRGLAGRETHAL